MPLEAAMIIIDNSEYMHNGAYQPTRFDAQKDAVTTNLVGLMTMAGKGSEVPATNTKDLGHILGALHTAASRVGGLADIPTAISVSQLALKHRQNKNLPQRVVVFICSPLSGPGSDEVSLVKLAKKPKKNSVNVDIVAFGEGADETQSSTLRAFVDDVSQGDNSHLVVVPLGPALLSEVLNSSPILARP
ncbi:hypothetical protein BDY19DRAFT_987116 [Irpex rosettiformis]|uniref:Uncharacterized protein n=1 Tax=Irpex rosettiformis TaxID=378272 RepID=A0ACB8TTP0_9APHY|nr:hypothetical protein BDY19DRAFT_987116 [Irpex rosettiformis]